jgi:hypothetical protein
MVAQVKYYKYICINKEIKYGIKDFKCKRIRSETKSDDTLNGKAWFYRGDSKGA